MRMRFVRADTQSRRAARTLLIPISCAASMIAATPTSASGVCEPAWVQTFSDPTTALSSVVNAMVVYNDGSGCPALYVGGSFTTAGGVTVNRIARWDGTSWSALGEGLGGGVAALAVYDDGLGGGPALYAAGFFSTAGGEPANNIARWDGETWTALGDGVDGKIRSLTVFDDASGNGPALYVGGFFANAGGVPGTRNLARWDGAAWSSVGNGFGFGTGVNALAAYDDLSGSGPALYVGGSFASVGSSPIVFANNIAKWDGGSWSPLGSGITAGPFGTTAVWALIAHDDGSAFGPALYVGGEFTLAGGQPALNVARWNGAWGALGSGADDYSVDCFAVFDDGDGPALYAGGLFFNAGGVNTMNIARWRNESWSSLGSGLLGHFVYALASFDDRSGAGPALYVGGSFTTSPAGDARLAKFQGCAPGADCPADITIDCRVDFDDLAIVLSNFGQTGPNIPGDVNNDDTVDFIDLSEVLARFGDTCP